MTNNSNRKTDLNNYKRVYFVGIGGISMSGLAELALAADFQVAGADMNQNPRLGYLQAKGVRIFQGHEAGNIDHFQPDLLVYSAAVPADNPELQRAADLSIKTVDRAVFLGWINKTFDRVINIAGTHGKTTTTAMCSLIMIEAGLDPTVHLGAELEQFTSTVRLGQPGGIMVSEACEYKNSFHKFFSTTAAILNIDFDHVDCFANLDAVIDSFVKFICLLPADGQLVLPAFDANVLKAVQRADQQLTLQGAELPQIFWFGDQKDRHQLLTEAPQFNWRKLNFKNGLASFDLYFHDDFYGHFQLSVPGMHTVANAAAAIACSQLNGASAQAAIKVLQDFKGAEGRFTETGQYRGARVIADYAHHPAAALATLEAAAKLDHNHIWVVFQPLTFNRTKALFDDYVQALKDCELVLFAEIFSDREQERDYISSADIAQAINQQGGRAIFCPSFQEIKEQLDQRVGPGDLILVLGPEDIRRLADQLTGRKHP